MKILLDRNVKFKIVKNPNYCNIFRTAPYKMFSKLINHTQHIKNIIHALIYTRFSA